jgi:HEAT repeat protein
MRQKHDARGDRGAGLIYNRPTSRESEEVTMITSLRPLSLRRFAVVPLLAVLAAFLVGCPGGEDGATRQAKAVFEQTMASNPEYAKYAVTVAHASRSPWARQRIIELIGSEHYPTALEAVRALQKDPPPEATEALQNVFANKRGALKLQAAIALGRLGDQQALDWLATEIEGGGAALNLDAAQLLAEQGNIEPLKEQFRKFLAAEQLDTRNEGYALLGAIGEPWATEMLLEGLGNEHGEDRQQAIIALGNTGDTEVANKIVRFYNTQGLVFATLEALGNLADPATVEAAEAMLGHDEKPVRVYAAVAAWRMGNAEKAIAVLEPLTNDEDPMTRRLVAEQLAPVEEEPAKQWLVALAQDADPTVRLAALRSLAPRARAGDAAVFVAASGDAEYEVATVALNVLAGLEATEEEIDQLRPLMDSDNPYIALSAAHTVLALKAAA